MEGKAYLLGASGTPPAPCGIPGTPFRPPDAAGRAGSRLPARGARFHLARGVSRFFLRSVTSLRTPSEKTGRAQGEEDLLRCPFLE